ncbi:MAG: M28 family peptidase [Cyclonatronaceae bacterium]
MKTEHIFFLLLLILITAACSSEAEIQPELTRFTALNREVPVFSGDSAYTHVRRQLEFGPRVPGSQAHTDTRNYLLSTLREHAGRRSVFTQNFTRTIYGDTLQFSNIIAAFNLEAADRIFLCAHWDTRPRADRDPDVTRRDDPIPGADDGASGVAVLLEMARILSGNPPPVGVDLVLFDGEDYGREGDLQYYFLGAREWAENPPVPGYSPRFGILLDMVGAEGAIFPKELYSLTYAKSLVDGVWQVASELGYGNQFPDIRGAAISDDHVVVNEQLGIPTINIIHHNSGAGNSVFPVYWHTHADNLDIISKETLGMTGTLLTEIIYNRIK